jgi:hypothetical protein
MGAEVEYVGPVVAGAAGSVGRWLAAEKSLAATAHNREECALAIGAEDAFGE